jgi:hypothetical protein
MDKIKAIRNLGEEMDGMDFITVCSILASHEVLEDDFFNSALYHDLLKTTQSNPEKTHSLMMRFREIDEEIAILDD